MFLKSLFAVVAAGSFVCVQAADFSKFYEIKRWTPAECTMSATKVNGKPAMIIDMPIDHKGGEKKYPVGWPRTYLPKLSEAEGNWSEGANFTCKVKLEFTGKTQRYPLTVHVFPKGSKKSITKDYLLKNNAENELVFDLSKVPGKQVSQIGFNISERNFKHGENFKITVSDFGLSK